MSDTIPIQALTEGDIRGVLGEALGGPTPVRAIADFVSAVDWSDMDEASDNVVSVLGKLEQLTTDVDERAVSVETFLERIRQLAPPSVTRKIELSEDFGAPGMVRNTSEVVAPTYRRVIGGAATSRIRLEVYPAHP